MSQTKKSKTDKKSMTDVSRPGESAPSATSKPVIVTNRPILKDPMVVEKSQNADEPSSKVELSRSVNATVQPLDNSGPGTPEATDDQDKSAEIDGVTADAAAEPDHADKIPAEDIPKAEEPALPPKLDEVEKPESESEMSADISPDEQPESSHEANEESNVPGSPDASVMPQPSSEGVIGRPESPAGNEDAAESPGIKQKPDAKAVEEAKHDAAIQQLIDSRQYELPIQTVEERKNQHFVVLGGVLAVLLVLIWLDIALDAHIISLGGLKPLTHFFSN